MVDMDGYGASLAMIAVRLSFRFNRIATLVRFREIMAACLCVTLTGLSGVAAGENRSDRLKDLQTAYIATADQKMSRAFSFRVSRTGRYLLESYQPHQPIGAGLRLRQ